MFALVIPSLMAAISMIIVAGFFIYTTVGGLYLLFQFRDCNMRLCLLPYVVLIGCLALILRIYLLLCAIIAAPFVTYFAIYAKIDFDLDVVTFIRFKLQTWSLLKQQVTIEKVKAGRDLKSQLDINLSMPR